MAIQNLGRDARAMPDASQNQTANKANAIKQANIAATAYGKESQKPSLKNATQVKISDKAKERALALAQANKAPDMDETKVAKYKELINSGKYKPDAEKIAEGIAKEAMRDTMAQSLKP